MNVGELKKALEGVADDVEVCIWESLGISYGKSQPLEFAKYCSKADEINVSDDMASGEEFPQVALTWIYDVL